MDKLLAYDTETTGLCPYLGDRMFAYSTCDLDGDVVVRRRDASPTTFRSKLRKLWSSGYIMVMHNAKFDMEMTLQEDVDISSDYPFEDTMLMAAVLYSHMPKDLKNLAYTLLGYNGYVDGMDIDAAVVKAAGPAKAYDSVPKTLLDIYQRMDAERTMLLCAHMLPKVREDATFFEIYEMEKRVVRVTMEMEKRGLLLNAARTKKILAELSEKRAHALSILPGNVNPMKPGDVIGLLFHDIGLPVRSLTRKKGIPSTDHTALLNLYSDYPECKELEAIVRFRSFDHGISIINSYLGLRDVSDVLHPSINTVGAHTGRESCSSPNLQNVQKADGSEEFSIPARRCFRPRPGYVNFHTDFAGIEARLAIHYSRDPAMLEIMRGCKPDPHSAAAELFYAEDGMWENADAKERKRLRNLSKNGQFCIIYGGGAPNLARVLGLSLDAAQRAKARYGRAFPGMLDLNRRIARQARMDGFILTEFGNKIRVDAQKAYVAVNYLIQGTAAGILKRAQIRVADFLKKRTHDSWKLLLPIHDELIIECPRRYLSRSRGILRKIREMMTDFPQFSVPMDIEVKCSTHSWADMEEVNLDNRP